MMNKGLKVEAIEAKLKELGFLPENNYILTRKSIGVLKIIFLGAFAQLGKDKHGILAINSKEIIFVPLTIWGNFSDSKPLIFDKNEYSIRYKKGILLDMITLNSKLNPKEVLKFDVFKYQLGISWSKRNLQNIVNDINEA